eukprot:2356918-Alexandrium_andersonii.AAC.1
MDKLNEAKAGGSEQAQSSCWLQQPLGSDPFKPAASEENGPEPPPEPGEREGECNEPGPPPMPGELVSQKAAEYAYKGKLKDKAEMCIKAKDSGYIKAEQG